MPHGGRAKQQKLARKEAREGQRLRQAAGNPPELLSSPFPGPPGPPPSPRHLGPQAAPAGRSQVLLRGEQGPQPRFLHLRAVSAFRRRGAWDPRPARGPEEGEGKAQTGVQIHSSAASCLAVGKSGDLAKPTSPAAGWREGAGMGHDGSPTRCQPAHPGTLIRPDVRAWRGWGRGLEEAQAALVGATHPRPPAGPPHAFPPAPRQEHPVP